MLSLFLSTLHSSSQGLIVYLPYICFIVDFQVSYVKSSDKYLIGCFIFVFLTLVEYCAVLLLKVKQKTKTLKVNKTLERPMVSFTLLMFTGY